MIGYIIGWLIAYRYLVILPIAIVEGPILGIICGFLIRLGAFTFWPVFLLLMLGDIISDIYWYYLGLWGGRRLLLKYGKFFGVNEQNIEFVEKLYHRHYDKILFFSKLTTGFGFAVAIVAVAGIVKVPFKRYMVFNILGQPIWSGILIGVGYFLGQFYLTISKGFEALSLISIIVIVGALIFGISRYMRTKIVKTYS